ncbi:hypothetical protein [Clostridium sp. KNHs214]|uniref:hypothetical protein n=1 Tax=Clostridium sp. KNHs214 TaxID=1540257 RepID=UPI00054D54C5|nr:hypothetical protein [Clostridium sp. KNHs214]
MNSLDNSISKELKKWRKRIFFKKAIDNLINFSFYAITAAIGLVVLSKFIPIYAPYIKSLWLILSVSVISVIYSFIKYPKEQEAAMVADTFGLKERVITALELREKKSESSELEKKFQDIYEIQKRDALNLLCKTNHKKIKLKGNKKYIKRLSIISLLMMSTLILPEPLKDKAQNIHEIKVAKNAQVKKIEKIKKDVNKNSDLKEWEKKTLKHNLTKLQEEIKKSEGKKEINKSLQKTSKKLELLREEYEKNDLQKIAEEFMKNNITKELGQALKNKDAHGIKKFIEENTEKLKKISPEDRKKLAESYKKLANDLKDNPKLASAVKKLGESIAKGDFGDLTSEMQELNDVLGDLMEDTDFQKAVRAVENSLASNAVALGQNGENSSGNSQEQSPKGSSGNAESGNSNVGSGDGASSGESSNVNGSGNGAGNGSSQGKEEESNKGNGQEGTGINKKENGAENNVKDYQRIFTTRTLGGQGETSNIEGKRGERGKVEEIRTSNGVTLRGQSVPYNEVVGEYKSRAMDNINSYSIPDGMKEIIKIYFSSLE